MMNAVTDISGINSISREVYRNAAAAVAGMAAHYEPAANPEKPLVLIGTLGTTEKCVRRVRETLEADGFEVMVFHTSGAGGPTMDSIAADRDVAAVLDLSLTEMVDTLFGGLCAGGPDRGKAGLAKGVPTIIAPGNVDFIIGGPIEAAQQQFPGRRYHVHNPALTAVRTNLDDLKKIADHVAALGRARRRDRCRCSCRWAASPIMTATRATFTSPTCPRRSPTICRSVLPARRRLRDPRLPLQRSRIRRCHRRGDAGAGAREARADVSATCRSARKTSPKSSRSSRAAPTRSSRSRTSRFTLRVAREGGGWTQDWSWDAPAERRPGRSPCRAARSRGRARACTRSARLCPAPSTARRSPARRPSSRSATSSSPDTVVAIIETMKLMNPVHAGAAGTIEAILFDNAAPVEAEAVLMTCGRRHDPAPVRRQSRRDRAAHHPHRAAAGHDDHPRRRPRPTGTRSRPWLPTKSRSSDRPRRPRATCRSTR